jgi:hypothetical protein
MGFNRYALTCVEASGFSTVYNLNLETAQNLHTILKQTVCSFCAAVKICGF